MYLDKKKVVLILLCKGLNFIGMLKPWDLRWMYIKAISKSYILDSFKLLRGNLWTIKINRPTKKTGNYCDEWQLCDKLQSKSTRNYFERFLGG